MWGTHFPAWHHRHYRTLPLQDSHVDSRSKASRSSLLAAARPRIALDILLLDHTKAQRLWSRDRHIHQLLIPRVPEPVHRAGWRTDDHPDLYVFSRVLPYIVLTLAFHNNPH